MLGRILLLLFFLALIGLTLWTIFDFEIRGRKRRP